MFKCACVVFFVYQVMVASVIAFKWFINLFDIDRTPNTTDSMLNKLKSMSGIIICTVGAVGRWAFDDDDTASSSVLWTMDEVMMKEIVQLNTSHKNISNFVCNTI